LFFHPTKKPELPLELNHTFCEKLMSIPKIKL